MEYVLLQPYNGILSNYVKNKEALSKYSYENISKGMVKWEENMR